MSNCKCAIVGPSQVDRLMRKYLGLVPGEMTGDEREILLFALYNESMGNNGIAARATAVGDARLKQQKERLEASESMRLDMYGENGNG